MLGIKYIGPVLDYSGYGEAARGYIFSLHEKGIPLTVSPRNFDINPPPIADKEKKEILDSLIDKDINYDTVIIHLTPDLYPRYVERGKYNIGFAAWETTLLHPKWVQSISSSVNEMWVPCDWNIKAFKDSGITVPIFKIPHGIDPCMFNGVEDKKFSIKELDDSTYKFYSIFQWTYRKNPEGLLRAYFNAFDDSDNVALILKTYRGGEKDREFVRNQILGIKKDMNVGNYPRVILIGDILSKTQMLGLHIYGDCYVSLHRGEGFGLPIFESGLYGNPTISTGYSGNLEFMKDDNSYLVDYQETFVSFMSSFNSWCLGNQKWAEPNQIHAMELMQHVFDNRDEAKQKGSRLKNYIIENFSWEKVANIIVNRLESI